MRLKNAYIIKGDIVEKDNIGNIKRIYCTYDPKSRSGSGTPESLRKVKGTIHWVDKNNFEKISVNIYDKLFNVEIPFDVLNKIETLSALYEYCIEARKNNV